jgi:hypothetical protein
MGPITDPSVIPEEQFRVDVEFPRRTVCDRLIKYEESHSNAVLDALSR